MQDRALIATRKGLFELNRSSAGWQLGPASFLGEPVSMLLSDRRDGALYAALNLGHFGVKLHRRDAGAANWTEIAVPAYPTQPEDSKDDVAWKLVLIWSLAAGGLSPSGGTIAAFVALSFSGTSRDGARCLICPAACSARAIAANRGNWSARCGTHRNAANG